MNTAAVDLAFPKGMINLLPSFLAVIETSKKSVYKRKTRSDTQG